MNIGIVCVMLAMIVTPLLIGNIKVNHNKITIFGQNIEYFRNENEIVVKDESHEEIITGKDEVIALNNVFDYIEDTDMFLVSISVELMFIGLIASLFIIGLVFEHLEQLFVNIHGNDTPFTLENIEHIKKMSYLLICIIVLSIVLSSLSQLLFKQDFSFDVEFANIFYILFLYSLSYIFEYGYEIQKDSKCKIYDSK